MPKFNSKNLEFADGQKALFGSNDDSSICWNSVENKLQINGNVVVSGTLNSNNVSYYGVSWDESADTYARTGNLLGYPTSQTLSYELLPIQSSMRRCILNDNGGIEYYLSATDSTKREDGNSNSDLTGAHGQVMVQIPAFYYKYNYTGTTHTWEISLLPAMGFSLHPAFIKNGSPVLYRYIGAYEGVGYDDSTSAYFDGDDVGDTKTHWPGTTTIDINNDKLGSVSGFAPLVNETRAEFRSLASNRGAGWRQQDYDLISAVQLLYLIEYADWNSQAMIGMGRTEVETGTWVKDSLVGVTGKSNSDGNGTNSVGGDTNNAYMTYRGIENFFGNILTFVDGVNIAEPDTIYICSNDADFADDTDTNYTYLGVEIGPDSGVPTTLVPTSRGFLPMNADGTYDTYITDYYQRDHTPGWCMMAFGGLVDDYGVAGIMSLIFSYHSSYDWVGTGSRLAY